MQLAGNLVLRGLAWRQQLGKAAARALAPTPEGSIQKRPCLPVRIEAGGTSRRWGCHRVFASLPIFFSSGMYPEYW